MSWYHLKSLDISEWHSKLDKKDNNDDLKIFMKNMFKRCGRFLTHLEVYVPYQSKWDSEIVDLILKECPKLKKIDIGYQNFESRNDIIIIKPIFDKVTKLKVSINESDINDEDLESLLTINKQLESFDITTNEKLTANVLNTLPCETIKKLRFDIYEESTFFLSDFHVSMHYMYFFSFLILMLI